MQSNSIRRPVLLGSLALALSLGIWGTGALEAATASAPMQNRYRVTVTNLTRGQIFSPTLVYSSDGSAPLYEFGAPASAGLALLAEDGDSSLLMTDLAGMLVSTNDGFLAVQNVLAPMQGEKSFFAYGYDAGSEANSEDCMYIPGPPCGNPGMHDPMPAEGYVHVHAGVHGGASLVPAMHDWRGPVARITIEKL